MKTKQSKKEKKENEFAGPIEFYEERRNIAF